MEASVRIAKHAGSWYQKKKNVLNEELDKYLAAAQCTIKNMLSLKAVIGPHAGYAYSGPTAAWAYKNVEQQRQKKSPSRVFLLGPSHKKYFEGCSLSCVSELETPLGNLKVDTQLIAELSTKGQFAKLTKKEEQNEHSLQMHLPYIYKTLGPQILVVPIIVGSTSLASAEKYGKILAPYFDRQDSMFIISSDFCHWGEHFDYQPQEEGVPIWKCIEKLDNQGMKLIEANNIAGFDEYIKKTENTICGQHPIRVLMNVIQCSKLGLKTNFVKYDQSEKIISTEDSSVSYASSVTYVAKDEAA